MSYRSLGLLLLCLFVLPDVVLAQNSSNWTVALYARQDDTIYVVSPQGVQQAILLPSYQGKKFVPQQISPDIHYAAGLIQTPGADQYEPPSNVPAIADLQTSTCCTLVNAPMASNEEFFIRFSNFNAESNHIILSTNNFSFDSNTGASQGSGVMSMVDAATGTIFDQITLDAFAYLGDWKPDGVRFLRAPLGGSEWLPDGHYDIWDIDAGTIREKTPDLTVWRGDILPITGEIINAAYNTDFPADEFGMITPANVIEYYSAGQNPFMNPAQYYTPGQVVFYDPQDLNLQVNWVEDGHAFMVNDGTWRPADLVTVVMRGGEQVQVSTPGQRYLTATPDGWLTYATDGTVYAYNRSGAGYVAMELARLNAPAEDNGPFLTVLTKPVLGTTVSGDEPGFPVVTHTIPAAPQNAVTCPGALVSRLVVGEQAWVLPGDSNNLRDKPSKKGAKVGELQAGMSFDVVEGPVCADGYAWWHVKDLFNQEGWTAEGDAKEYWVEPIR